MRGRRTGGRIEAGQAQGVRRLETGPVALRFPEERPPAARKGQARPLQIPAMDRIPQRAAEDGDRKDSEVQAPVKSISRVTRVIPSGPSSQVDNKQLVIGAEGWEKTSPFLFLAEDWFSPPGGFEEHPHRGMQTVTIVLEGELEHRDHTGAHGLLQAGDVQWVTAGRGVLPSEMPKGNVHTLQLWLNLPAKMKMIPARYQDQRLKDVATNGRVRVYAGKSGTVSPGNGGEYPMWLLEIRGNVEQEIPSSYRGF